MSFRVCRRDRHGPEAAPERGLVRRRAAALCRRGRHGRSAGRRDRLQARGGRARGHRRRRAVGRGARDALIQEANRRVYERSNDDPNASGMGTTVTAALVEDGTVTFGHVGDSRAYSLSRRQPRADHRDHSLVNELMKSGKLSPEEAETHPQRSVITRALGTDPDVDVDSFMVETQAGDVFLLCSDGLTTMVDDGDILDCSRTTAATSIARRSHSSPPPTAAAARTTSR